MNYRKLEYILYNYSIKKSNIANLKVELSNLVLPSGISGVNYEEKILTGKISNQPETAYLNKEAREIELKTKLDRLEKELIKIDNAMLCLKELERDVIELRYLKGYQWWQIALKLKYSETWLKRVRKQALNKMIKTYK